MPPALFLAVFVVLTVVQGNSIWKRAMVRGWLPGAKAFECPAIEKGREGDVFHVRFDFEGLRLQEAIDRDLWDGLGPGSVVVARLLPRERTPRLERGLYAATGQVVFDGFLLLLWIAGLLWSARRFVIRRAHSRFHRV